MELKEVHPFCDEIEKDIENRINHLESIIHAEPPGKLKGSEGSR